jgi:hypothetical protein
LNLMLLYHSPEKLRHICARVFAPLYTIISIYAKAYLYIIHRIQFFSNCCKKRKKCKCVRAIMAVCFSVQDYIQEYIRRKWEKQNIVHYCSAFLIFILLMQSATAL